MSTAAALPPSSTTSNPGPLPARWALPLLTLVLYGAVLVVHGLVPGVLFPTMGIPYPVMGRAHSLAVGGLFDLPRHFGYPYGAPIVSGLPTATFQALLIRAGLSDMTSYIATHALFLAIGFVAATALCRRLGATRWLAPVGAALYLGSHFVVAHQGFANLMLGFALIPLSILVDFGMRERFKSGHRPGRDLLIWAGIAGATKVLVLFTDGYSFMISALFSGVVMALGAGDRLRRREWWPALTLVAAVVFAHAVAYATYVAYVPAARSYATMPADFFRAQGVDLATTVIPLNHSTQLSLWLHLPVGGHDGREFYGDGTNAFFNYLGVGLLFAIPGAIFAWRRHPAVRVLIFAGAACFAAALGPALKINSVRSDIAKGKNVRFADYLMPPAAAVLNFHTETLYRNLPGVRVMRSVYRWQAGSRIVLTVLALLFISSLYEQRRLVLATVLLGLLAVDTFPPIGPKVARYQRNTKQMSAFYDRVIPELRKAIPPGQTVLFLTNENAYLANPIGAALECRLYNVGGDKNNDIARQHWPAEVARIIAWDHVLDNARALHSRGQLDFLVVPHFSLRWDSYRWPPPPARLRELRAQGRRVAIAATGKFPVTVGEFATVVDFRDQPAATPAGPAPAPR